MKSTKIYMVGPVGGQRGGVSRYADYLVREAIADPTVEIESLDSYGGSAARSLLALPRSVVLISLLPRHSHIHVNMSIRGSSVRKMIVIAAALLRHHQVVVHIHGSDYPGFLEDSNRAFRILMRQVLRRVDRVLTLSASDKRRICDILNLDPKSVAVVPNGVPGPRDYRGPARRTGPVKIIFLGDLGDRKGAGVLLSALSIIDAELWECTLAGTGDVAAAREAATSLGLSGVRVTGWLGEDEVGQLLQSADCLVLPSRAEGLPLSVLEGLAHGLAVVATPVGGLADALGGGAGILVEPGSAEDLATAIRTLVSSDQVLEHYQICARKRWEQQFSVSLNWERVKRAHGVKSRCAG